MGKCLRCDVSHFQVSTAARARSESDKRSPSFSETIMATGRPPATVGRSTTHGRVRRPREPDIELALFRSLPYY